MAMTQTYGIVLQTWNAGEADRTYRIYTDTLGKVTGWARSVRKAGSKLAGHLEPITHTHLQLSHGQRGDKILQAITREGYVRLRRSPLRIATAFACFEAVDQLTRSHAPDHRLYELLLTALRQLNREEPVTRSGCRYLAAGALLKVLALAGFKPNVSRCVDPRHPHGASFWFSAMRGGVVCDAHRGAPSLTTKLSPPVHEALRSLLARPLAQLLDTDLPPPVLSTVERLCENYLGVVTDGKRLRSLTSLRVSLGD